MFSWLLKGLLECSYIKGKIFGKSVLCIIVHLLLLHASTIKVRGNNKIYFQGKCCHWNPLLLDNKSAAKRLLNRLNEKSMKLSLWRGIFIMMAHLSQKYCASEVAEEKFLLLSTRIFITIYRKTFSTINDVESNLK